MDLTTITDQRSLDAIQFVEMLHSEMSHRLQTSHKDKITPITFDYTDYELFSCHFVVNLPRSHSFITEMKNIMFYHCTLKRFMKVDDAMFPSEWEYGDLMIATFPESDLTGRTFTSITIFNPNSAATDDYD